MSGSIRSFPNIPEDLSDKDLFGMGYPYYISLYSDLVAFSTDYGVALIRYDPLKFK